jgi:dipeptidyl aminopeptidase/acylaminoacyl peptidase
LLLASAHPWAAAGQGHPRPLDHDDFERWRAIREETISPDGRWAAYVLSGRNGSRLRLQALPAGVSLELPRGHQPHFTQDGRFVVATVDAAGGTVGSRAPDTLAVVDLERLAADPSAAAQAVERVAGLLSVQVSERGRSTIAYRLGLSGPEGVLVVRTLGPAAERRVRDVSEYRLSADGERVWYVRDDQRGSEDGVYRMEAGTGASTPLMVQEGMYTGLAVSRDAARAAFLFAPSSSAAPAWRLHAVLDDRVRAVVSDGAPELTPGWRVRRDAPLHFSDSGTRLFFGTVPPSPPPADADADQGVTVDVWSWTDPYLQPMQLARAEADRERTYTAVARLDGGAVVQLEQPGGPDLVQPRSGDELQLLALTDEPYRQLLSWDARYTDAYLVDVETGIKQRIIEKLRGNATLSPTGRWVTWWDGAQRAWQAMDAATGSVTSLTAGIPVPVHDEQHDRPGPADPYGLAGWTEGDAHALVYDNFDLWRVDPRGQEPAVSVTRGVGRREAVRLRLAAPVPFGVITDERLLLAAVDVETHDAGFWAAPMDGSGEPHALLMSPHRFGVPLVAASADRVLLTRESFSEYPDLWVASADLKGLARVTDVNPQQTEFAWGTEELVSWTSADGTPLKGILYKPQGFDPAKKYPLIVHLYERATDAFHEYHDPAPGSASINRSFYVSRGYLVFAPDIVYRVGDPGQSVEDAVIPGVRALIASGIVDPERVGVQGHSWGGWEAAHLVTRTNLFKAAIAGAPVANMTSAYGGVRWGSGMSRMFQYESEQSRIGTTLWETPERYIENSPLFGADRVATPLLLLHNDEDSAVPFEQGIELFSALRRLGKPAWMVNYNGELHGIRRAANRRDWAIRMQQFFDHYLLGEAAPVWMVQGIPAAEKGRTLGLELTEEPKPATDGEAR